MRERIRARRPLIALIAALGLIVAACGDGDEPASAEAMQDASASSDAADASRGDNADAADRATGADWPDSLRMVIIPSTDTVGVDEVYGPVAQLLEAEIGIGIELLTATDYAGVIEAAIANDADIVLLGPFAYVIGTLQDAPLEAVAISVSGPDVEPGYRAVLSTRADRDDLVSLEDTLGKQVCFVDPGSASGYLVPSAAYLAIGADPETDVTPIFAGAHDTSVLAARDGDCDAAFSTASRPDYILIESGDIAEGELKRLWESDLIPGSPLAVNTNLPVDLQDAIKNAVLSINGEDLYAAGDCGDDQLSETDDGTPFCSLSPVFNIWGYTAVTDATYDPIREICELTQAPACQG